MDPSQYPDDPNMPALKDIFYSDDEEDVEVYVCQPPRFEDPDYPDKVYKVVKALYGSHQALRAWSMIGSLMYLTSSRQDILFAICACARFYVTPKVSHLHAVKRIFRYLKGKPHLGLWYIKDSPFNLVAYTDSDYAGASLDRKSTTGGCQFLGRKFNFSKYIFDIMVRNVDSPSKFLMYQRFLQLMINPRVDDLSSHTTKYTSPALTQKVFANMRRIDKGFSGVETLLFATMLVQPQAVAEEEGDDDEVSAALTPP
nr:uncharacterized mitochondrial protein AtMg00810-like [Tanacetum cinerariifolium]